MTSRAARSWWHSPAITGSAALASVLSLVLFPILTRLYTPSDIGRYGLFVAAASVLGSVVTARYDVAALAAPHDPDGDAEADRLCRLSLFISVGAAGVVALLVVPLVLIEQIGTEMLWLPLAALGIAITGLQITFDARGRRYGITSALAVTRVVLFVVAAMGLAFVNRSAFALCAASVVATVPSCVRVGLLLHSTPGHLTRPWTLAREYRDYPMFQAPAALLNAAPMLILTTWVDRVAGAVVLGFVVAAARIQMAPVGALGSAVTSVLTTDVVAEGRAVGPVQRRYVRALFSTTGLTVASGMFAIVIAGWLELLLGPQWTGLRPYLIALLPLAAAFMVASIPTAVLSMIGQQRQVLLSRVWLLALLAGGFLVASALVAPGAMMVAVGSSVYLIGCLIFALATYRRIAGVLGAPIALEPKA